MLRRSQSSICPVSGAPSPATTLITSIRALSADPADGAQLDGERFTQVRTGTRVSFELQFDTSSLPKSMTEQRYPLALRVEGEDGTLLSEDTLDLVVAAQAGCNP